MEKKVSKQFACSQEGKRDGVAVANMQSYVQSQEAVVWLESYSENNSTKKQNISGIVICSDWPTCLLSASITFDYGKYLRLTCLKKSGIKKNTFFHCPPSGKADKRAVAEIQTCVDSVSFHTWLESGYIHTGIPARRFLDNMLFDKRIKIYHSKSVNIKRDDDILLVSNMGRIDNKQFHRTDDSFEPLDSEDVEGSGSKIAAIMYVSCSSHTSVCKNECGWKLKLILKEDNMNNWEIFEHNQNSLFHSSKPNQKDRHMSQTMKDKIDRARMTGKTAPSQIYIAENPTSILTHGDTNNSPKSVNLRQISNRCHLIDRHYLGKDLSKDRLTNSDWRNAEIILENNFDSVLLYQRGDANLNRNYHIVLASDGNIRYLEKFGVICGYDVKHDLNAARFKTSILTYCDSTNKGRIGMAAISNCEISEVHKMQLEITIANMPCHHSNCAHKKHLYIFNDNNGFFHLRLCTLKYGSEFQPII